MDLQRFCIKIFLKPGSKVNHPAVVEVFHAWVKDQALPLSLIDVADYTHVPDAPGTLLVGHETNLYFDDLADQEGLVCQCKTEQKGSLFDRVTQALEVTKKACDMLQKTAATGVEFDLTQAYFISNDRLLLPNTDDGFALLQKDLFGIGDVERVENDPKERLTASFLLS